MSMEWYEVRISVEDGIKNAMYATDIRTLDQAKALLILAAQFIESRGHKGLAYLVKYERLQDEIVIK